MAKLSRNVKETIKTIAFLLVVGVLIFFYMIYPLSRTKAAAGRPEVDDYNPDSLIANEMGAYVELGLCDTGLTASNPGCDTFRVETDGLTNIACLWLAPPSGADSALGTIFLLHDDGANRDSVALVARALIESGYCVVAYDQRGAGRSSGSYRGEGRYEADDLQEVIRHLDLRGRIIHPVTVIGWSTGADAGLLCALTEARIDGVIAISPYLSSGRWLDIQKQKHDIMWFPFFRTMMWWWYNIRSSYAAPYREVEDIKAVGCPTFVMIDNASWACDEVVRLKEVSDSTFLEIGAVPTDYEHMIFEIRNFVGGISHAAAVSEQ